MSSEIRFSRDHEWVKVEGGIAIVGVSEHAVEELGDVIYVELPEVGDSITAGGKLAVVESVKAASDVFSPLAGKVIEVNEALPDDPGMLNEDPMENGWIAKIEVSDASEFKSLMVQEEYDEYLKEAGN